MEGKLHIGDRFVSRLGPRRLLYPGDTSYFQKNNRRYFCKVVSARDEAYRHPAYGRCYRRILDLEVVDT